MIGGLFALLLLPLKGTETKAFFPQDAEQKISRQIYRIALRVHIAKSSRPPQEFVPIFKEINDIWLNQAGICFEIEAVGHDTPHEDGIDMWFSPDLGFYNGYYDGEFIQMSDNPDLIPARNPARSSAARTAAHELGHALGLGHRQESVDNLMASKTYGWQLQQDEVDMAREEAAFFALPGSEARSCNPPTLQPALRLAQEKKVD